MSRASKRLLSNIKNTQLKEDQEILEDDEDKEVEEEEENKVVCNSGEDRPCSFEETIVEQTNSYADEDLREILNNVVILDPNADGTCNSVNGLDKINTCKSTKPKKDKKTPIIRIKLDRTNKKLNVKALNERKGRCIQTDKVIQSTRLTRSSRGRPLQNNKTTLDLEKTSNVSPKKKDESRTAKRNTQGGGSHSNNIKDSPDVEKPFSCMKCDKSFQYKSALKLHKGSHTDTQPYVCDRCPSRFSQQSHLTRHSLVHKKNSKKFKCDTCKMSFRQNYYLEVHKRIHSGIKPYKCDECSKCFSQKSHLNTHIKTHKEKEFYCDICTKSFTLSHHLSSHKINVHKKL